MTYPKSQEPARETMDSISDVAAKKKWETPRLQTERVQDAELLDLLIPDGPDLS
ncbi:MAG: hypothetical protein ACK4QW_03195 [Alphaproteobacteria bacterium]